MAKHEGSRLASTPASAHPPGATPSWSRSRVATRQVTLDLRKATSVPAILARMASHSASMRMLRCARTLNSERSAG